MKYEVGQVYDFRYNNPPVPENMQYRPSTIVDISKNGLVVGRYNVIWSSDTIIRGLITEMYEDVEYDVDHKVLFSLTSEAIETLKNKGSVTYEIVFNMEKGYVVYDVFGPYLVPGENNGA